MSKISHVQILNIAIIIEKQKYALNKQRAIIIKKYVFEQEYKEQRAKKMEELLKLYRYVWKTPILSQTISFEEAINRIDKLEEELK